MDRRDLHCFYFGFLFDSHWYKLFVLVFISISNGFSIGIIRIVVIIITTMDYSVLKLSSL